MISSIKNALFYLRTSFKVKALRKNLLSNYSQKKNLDYNILFCPFNSNILNMSREGVMATRCQLEGANVSFLQYDIFTEAREFLPGKSKFHLRIYYMMGRLFYRINGFKAIRYSKYNAFQNIEKIKRDIEQLEVNDISTYTYKGAKIGQYSIASTIREYLSSGPLWNDPEFVSRVKSYLLTCCITADGFEQILKQNKIDKIVTSHAIYCSWGVIFDVARNQGYEVSVYNSSYRKNTLRFYKNTPSAPFPQGEWARFEKLDMSKAEETILDEYIKTREDQRADNISLFKGDTEYQEVDAFINKAKSKGAKLACMFTNISWDAYGFSKDAKFSSMDEWVVKTIEYATENPDLYLLIKAHPAENYFKVPAQYRVSALVPKDLPENIFFITEHMQVKPFGLYPHLDFGIIHISTVCIEMALENIPVITSGANGHYSNMGFTIDPDSTEDYFEKLGELVKGESTFKPDITMARRYMYYRFFREAIPFGFVQVQNGQIEIDKHLSNDKNRNLENLDIISQGIMQDGIFVSDWSKKH